MSVWRSLGNFSTRKKGKKLIICSCSQHDQLILDEKHLVKPEAQAHVQLGGNFKVGAKKSLLISASSRKGNNLYSCFMDEDLIF